MTFITDEQLAFLIEHTGQWSLVFTGALSGCYSRARAARRSIGLWEGHRWEARVQRRPERKGELYVRHLSAGAQQPEGA
jgi:hypothetical protein